jgi:hypothetical protein
VLAKSRPATPFSLGAVESAIVCPTARASWGDLGFGANRPGFSLVVTRI